MHQSKGAGWNDFNAGGGIGIVVIIEHGTPPDITPMNHPTIGVKAAGIQHLPSPV